MDLFPTLDVFWSVPTTDTFNLESVVETFGKCFVLIGVTDKDRIELNRFVEEGG
jgi:hypothetical protein